MHKHAKSNFHSRVLIVKKHLEEGVAVAELVAYFDISPSLIYRWLRHYKTLGLQGLKDRSSRPKHCPNRTKSWQEQAIKALALGGWAQTDIAQTLKLPLSTVCVVVHRMCGRLLKRIEPVQRYEYDEPGGMIHFNIKRVARFSWATSSSRALPLPWKALSFTASASRFQRLRRLGLMPISIAI